VLRPLRIAGRRRVPAVGAEEQAPARPQVQTSKFGRAVAKAASDRVCAVSLSPTACHNRTTTCSNWAIPLAAALTLLSGSALAQPTPRSPAQRREAAPARPQVPSEAQRPRAEQPGLPSTATPGAAESHVLAGVWKVYWLEENKSTELRIGQVFPGPNITKRDRGHGEPGGGGLSSDRQRVQQALGFILGRSTGQIARARLLRYLARPMPKRGRVDRSLGCRLGGSSSPGGPP
jgi:hypothetical protein